MTKHTTIKSTKTFSNQLGIVREILGISKQELVEQSFWFYVNDLSEQGKIPKEWNTKKAKRQRDRKLIKPEIKTEPKITDTIKLAALHSIKSGRPGAILLPLILRNVDNSLICEIAKLHSFVANSFEELGAPAQNKLSSIVFQLNLDELSGAAQYLIYFEKYVVPEKKDATNMKMFELVNDLKQKVAKQNADEIRRLNANK